MTVVFIKGRGPPFSLKTTFLSYFKLSREKVNNL